MQLESDEGGGWRLAGSYDAQSLLKIKKSVSTLGAENEVALDVSELASMNAPTIALLLEFRRHCDVLTLVRCRDDFKEMLQLYGLECIFRFA